MVNVIKYHGYLYRCKVDHEPLEVITKKPLTVTPLRL